MWGSCTVSGFEGRRGLLPVGRIPPCGGHSELGPSLWREGSGGYLGWVYVSSLRSCQFSPF